MKLRPVVLEGRLVRLEPLVYFSFIAEGWPVVKAGLEAKLAGPSKGS